MPKGKKSKSKPKYKGKLSQPIWLEDPNAAEKARRPGMPYLKTNAAAVSEWEAIQPQVMERLSILFTQYGIDENRLDKWMLLSLALAHDHVPGFKVVYKQGAPTKRSLDLYCDFYRYFIKEKSKRLNIKKTKISDTLVLNALLKDANFQKTFPSLSNLTLKSLQNLISEARHMRKNRVHYFLSWYRLKKSKKSKDDIPAGLILGDPPPWTPRKKQKSIPKSRG